MNDLTSLQQGQLHAELVRVAGELAWRLAGQTGAGMYHRNTDLGDIDATRTARLVVLQALRHMAAELDKYTADVARAAAEAGADYSDLAASAGLASRQLARHTWPGLAPVTKAARDNQRALRGAPRWTLRHDGDVWQLARDGKPYGDHDGLAVTDTTEAALWAAEQIAEEGWRVAGWTEPDDTGARAASLSGSTSLPRAQDIPAN
ncbi:hypothetical protein AB0M47_20850 [Hamadaea sp. NPDC051192]|uniref:hypothetical protein n=1 Tax=Hamadaea sp. NPDC051192 TaxID=3154940 RepID=UPI0034149261